MAWKIEAGMAKGSLWPEPGNGQIWKPTEQEEDEIFQLPGVLEVGSECAGPFKIIVEAESVEQLPRVLARVAEEAMEIIRKYAPERRRERTLERHLLAR
jgi:hypothetical protein